MNRNARNAWNALKKIGCPVLDPSLGWGGFFALSAEHYGKDDGFYEGHKDYDPDGNDWADYYNSGFGEFGVSTHITEVLGKHGLYCEWINAGVLAVYDS
jgi:hypothetical protein